MPALIWSSRSRAQVFLSNLAFRQLEDLLRASDPAERQQSQGRLISHLNSHGSDRYSPYAAAFLSAPPIYGNADFAQSSSTAALPLVHRSGDGLSPSGYDIKTVCNSEDGDPVSAELGAHHFADDQSSAPSGYAPSRPMFDPGKKPEKELRGTSGATEVVEEVRQTRARRNWVLFTWLATWWIPSCCLSRCGGMKRKDVRMAWREKLLIKCVDLARVVTAAQPSVAQHAHLVHLRGRRIRRFSHGNHHRQYYCQLVIILCSPLQIGRASCRERVS